MPNAHALTFPLIVSLALTAGLGCSEPRLGELRQATVYGEDDRMEYYAHPDDTVRKLTRESIIAMFTPEALEVCSPEDLRPIGIPLGESENLCDDQLFLEQLRAASCSATLIDDDLIITAGHCVEDEAQCFARRFVFDYYYVAEGQLETITRDELYSCRRLVAQRFEYDQTLGEFDHAIIQLDRPVASDRVPVPVIKDRSQPVVGDPVVTVGFGKGVPAKLDSGGETLYVSSKLDNFDASVDAFPGNSGSGVFNANLEMIGVLTKSQGGDFMPREGADCYEALVLPPEGKPTGTATTVKLVGNAIDDLCATGWPSERLCGKAATCGDGICTGRETHESCAEDCPQPTCGDGVCSLDEDFSCPEDCGADWIADCPAPEPDAGRPAPDSGADVNAAGGDSGGCQIGGIGGGRAGQLTLLCLLALALLTKRYRI